MNCAECNRSNTYIPEFNYVLSDKTKINLCLKCAEKLFFLAGKKICNCWLCREQRERNKTEVIEEKTKNIKTRAAMFQELGRGSLLGDIYFPYPVYPIPSIFDRKNQMAIQSTSGYIVASVKTGPNSNPVTHPNYESARKEAIRLAGLKPTDKFIVYQPVIVVSADVKVKIEPAKSTFNPIYAKPEIPLDPNEKNYEPIDPAKQDEWTVIWLG